MNPWAAFWISSAPLGKSIYYHGGNQPSVVGGFSANAVCRNEAAPFLTEGIGIREPENRRLDAGQHSLGLALWATPSRLFATGRE